MRCRDGLRMPSSSSDVFLASLKQTRIGALQFVRIRFHQEADRTQWRNAGLQPGLAERETRSAVILSLFLPFGFRKPSLLGEEVGEVPDYGVWSVFLSEVGATGYRLQLRTGDGLVQLFALL